MSEGDLFGLDLALEATASDDMVAKYRATAVREQSRLAGLVARYGIPEKGSSGLHVEESEAGLVTHSLRVDGAGRLTIRTVVQLSCRFQKCFHHN